VNFVGGFVARTERLLFILLLLYILFPIAAFSGFNIAEVIFLWILHYFCSTELYSRLFMPKKNVYNFLMLG